VTWVTNHKIVTELMNAWTTKALNSLNRICRAHRDLQ